VNGAAPLEHPGTGRAGPVANKQARRAQHGRATDQQAAHALVAHSHKSISRGKNKTAGGKVVLATRAGTATGSVTNTQIAIDDQVPTHLINLPEIGEIPAEKHCGDGKRGPLTNKQGAFEDRAGALPHI